MEKYSYASIARELGISKAVVSSVIRNTSATTVSSPATKKRILEMAWSNGLRLNNNIGIVVPREVVESKILYHYGLVGIIEKCAALGYGSVSISTDGGTDIPAPLLNKEVSSIIFWNELPEFFKEFALAEKIPYVLLNPSVDQPDCDVVAFNDYNTMFELLEYFYANGYRKFYYLLENMDSAFNRKTTAGMRNFAAEFKVSGTILTPEDKDIDDVLPQLDEAVRNTDRHTVFITFARFYTIKILETLSKYGKQIPNDAGVAGSNLLADFYMPRLTTVEYPFYDMGAAAVEILHEKWNSRQYFLRRKKIIKGTIIKNGSTIQPPEE